MRRCAVLGAPVQSGASQLGCLMGPDSLRTAGLITQLGELGWDVTDLGNAAIPSLAPRAHPNPAVHHLAETTAWIDILSAQAQGMARDYDLPIFLGGDHSMSAGTVTGVAAHAATLGRPLFVLWLDAHPDFHTLETTTSGNLHGTPVSYFTGHGGMDAYPALPHSVPESHVCMMGIRSVDPDERSRLKASPMHVYDMRSLDEHGVMKPLNGFLESVNAANGLLHVSFDVDFLDPSIAPGVGTTVPGGATFREAHLIMETLHDSGVVTSLDLVELNPFLDERGRTAALLVDLAASLFGRRVLDRKTRSFA